MQMQKLKFIVVKYMEHRHQDDSDISMSRIYLYLHTLHCILFSIYSNIQKNYHL